MSLVMEPGPQGLVPILQDGGTVADAANLNGHTAAAEEPRKRRHKWGPPAAGEFANAYEQKPKKRRSRWETSTELIVPTAKSGAVIIPGQIPREVTICNGAIKVMLANQGGITHSDPKVQKLHDQLNDLQNKLDKNELDIPPEHERSPSPEPIYDASGCRLNTREIRAREKLIDRRNRIIEEVIKHDPDFKPPADYRPRKFSNKIYIPINEYPGYNFIGLIIGPRGNTQKRMQRETNCKIAIRGKGSIKEGISKDPKYDYGEDEELHVLITGETQDDVDRASAMVEKLCTPSDEEHEVHKRLQLRELAALNGTLKDLEACFVCGEAGHDAEHCPKRALEVYKLPEQMATKVQEQYERDVARVHGGGVVSMDAEYKSFLQELGGGPPPELMGLDPSGAPRREQLPDECKLYVGNLPPAYDSAMLRQLFEPHAKVVHTAVITEPGSGVSRGFGFVHIPDPAQAMATRQQMDGYLVDGRALVVRLRSERGQPGGTVGRPAPGEVDESKLYVAGLTPTVQEHVLRELFGKFGQVTEVRIITDRETNLCKGFSFIGFASREQAAAAKEGMDGYKMEGKPLIVRIAGQKDERPPRRDDDRHDRYERRGGDRDRYDRGRDRDDDRYERRGRGRDYDRDHRDRDHDDDRQGGLRGPHGLIHPPPGILLAPGAPGGVPIYLAPGVAPPGPPPGGPLPPCAPPGSYGPPPPAGFPGYAQQPYGQPPGAPPPYGAPPAYGAYPGAPPPYGAPPPGHYPGYAPPPGAPHMYGAPPPSNDAAAIAAAAASAAQAAAGYAGYPPPGPPPQGYEGYGGPAPPAAAPPLPPGAPPLPPGPVPGQYGDPGAAAAAGGGAQSEYDRFMQDLQRMNG